MELKQVQQFTCGIKESKSLSEWERWWPTRALHSFGIFFRSTTCPSLKSYLERSISHWSQMIFWSNTEKGHPSVSRPIWFTLTFWSWSLRPCSWTDLQEEWCLSIEPCGNSYTIGLALAVLLDTLCTIQTLFPLDSFQTKTKKEATNGSVQSLPYFLFSSKFVTCNATCIFQRWNRIWQPLCSRTQTTKIWKADHADLIW